MFYRESCIFIFSSSPHKARVLVQLVKNKKSIIATKIILIVEICRTVNVRIINVFVPALYCITIYTSTCIALLWLKCIRTRLTVFSQISCDINYSRFGCFSSIHLLGRFATVTWLPDTGPPSISLSANRFLFGRAGQGRMLDADTVKTVAKKVNPKSDETNVRRCFNRRTLCMDIL